MSEPFFDADSDDSSSASTHEGLPKATMVTAAIAIVCVGAATFFGMQWKTALGTAKALRTELIPISEQDEALRTELNELKRQFADLQGRTDVLSNGKFEVCNESSKNVTVSKLAATYVDEAGKFRTFNSEGFGSRIWQIVPGERKLLTFDQGDVDWDGSVVYFAAILDGQYPYAGMWPPTTAGCLRWTD